MEALLARPLALLLAPALAALLVLLHSWGFKRVYLKRFVLLNPLARVVRVERKPRRRATLALKLALAALLALTLSQPYVTVEREVVVESGGEVEVRLRLARPVVIVIVDVSGSMSAEIPGGVKAIEAAKEAVRRLVEGAPQGVDVGLIAFSDRIEAAVPPTSDRKAVLAVVNALESTGGTMYTYPLRAALNWLAPYTLFGSPTLVVFVSDGLPADMEYRGLLPKFKALNVSIHTIYIGGVGESGEAEMQLIARETGGEQYTAEAAQQLISVFEGLASRVGEMAVRAQERLKAKRTVREVVNLSWAPAIAAATIFTLLLAARYRASQLTF